MTNNTNNDMNTTKGKDGFSPIVTAKEIEGGTEISIQDSTHTETFVVKDGTSGTLDYENLQNKPLVNDTMLEGNKTFKDLGVIPLSNTEIIQIINKAAN